MTSEAAAPYDLMRPGDFRTWPVSQRLLAAPAMLHPSERQAISYYAAKAYRFCGGEGAFVDAGSFVGGSLVAAIEGVERAVLNLEGVGKRFFAYDLFQTNQYMIDHYPDRFSGRNIDADFLDVFHDVVGDYGRLVHVYKGDIVTAPKVDGPIAFLFVDILWSWRTNAVAIEEWYPRLVAGKSLLVHQDFVYPFYPWLPITMEYYSEYFEFFDYAEYSTAIYRVKKPFPRIDGSLVEKLDVDLQMSLLDRAANRFEGWARGSLRLSKALHLWQRDHRVEALELFREIEKEYAGAPLVAQYLPAFKTIMGAA
jgi:hypothetical protein